MSLPRSENQFKIIIIVLVKIVFFFILFQFLLFQAPPVRGSNSRLNPYLSSDGIPRIRETLKLPRGGSLAAGAAARF